MGSPAKTPLRAALALPIFCLILSAASRSHAAPKEEKPKPRIAWLTSFSAAREEAKRTGKPIMIDFWATWCAPCRKMDDSTYSHPSVIRQANKFVMLKVDIEEDTETVARYKVETPPKVVFLKADGALVGQFEGFRDAASMVKSMKWVLSRMSSSGQSKK